MQHNPQIKVVSHCFTLAPLVRDWLNPIILTMHFQDNNFKIYIFFRLRVWVALVKRIISTQLFLRPLVRCPPSVITTLTTTFGALLSPPSPTMILSSTIPGLRTAVLTSSLSHLLLSGSFLPLPTIEYLTTRDKMSTLLFLLSEVRLLLGTQRAIAMLRWFSQARVTKMFTVASIRTPNCPTQPGKRKLAMLLQRDNHANFRPVSERGITTIFQPKKPLTRKTTGSGVRHQGIQVPIGFTDSKKHPHRLTDTCQIFTAVLLYQWMTWTESTKKSLPTKKWCSFYQWRASLCSVSTVFTSLKKRRNAEPAYAPQGKRSPSQRIT